MDALGFLEVQGLVTAISAADAMVKSAKVKLLPRHEVRPGLITLIVSGDLAACRAAVSAGVAAATPLGQVISHHVIGRLDEDATLNQLITMGYTCQVAHFAQKIKPSTPLPPPVVGNPNVVAPVVPLTPTQENKAQDPILAFLAAFSKGKTVAQIKQQFADLTLRSVQAKLTSLVASGLLTKRGAKYYRLKK